MCFSGVIPQLYAKFDADTLFPFEVPGGAVKRDAQSISIRYSHKIPTGQSLLDCHGNN
jgi:hypothetical protein